MRKIQVFRCFDRGNSDVAEHFEKHFLSDVGCVRWIVQQAQRQVIDGLLKSKQKSFVGLLVAQPQGADEARSSESVPASAVRPEFKSSIEVATRTSAAADTIIDTPAGGKFPGQAGPLPAAGWPPSRISMIPCTGMRPNPAAG